MSERPNEPGRETRSDTGGDMLRAGVTLAGGQYRIEKFLNSGGFGMTYLARNSLDRIVVIKECFPSFLCHRKDEAVEVRSMDHLSEYLSLVNLFRAEARALARLQHRNIVGVHEVFDDNKTAYMAMDFVEGKDLQEIVETDPERIGPFQLREILTTVLGAVSYIHEQGVLHRDISPDNILLDRHNTPVLIDFGSARDSGRKSKLSTRLQSVKDGYSPHEFYARKMKHSASSDLYALAATFYFAITGEAPPPSQYRLAAMIERRQDPYLPLKGRYDRYDPRVLETIDKALAVVAADRVQSARSWLLAIDDQSRKVAALEKARSDARIEKLVQDLVLETNTALERQAAEEARLEREAEAQKKALQAQERKKAKQQRKAMSEALEEFQVPTEEAAEMSSFESVDTEAERNISGTGESAGGNRPAPDPRITAQGVDSVPRVVRSPKDPAEQAHADAPYSRTKHPRRGFAIKWNLPPLYVSNRGQLAGEFDG
ncbi:serine/threonine-protein kinase [Tropicimonas sp. IMCC6043]|uniref:serine/threonine protein kinase n=1 Tax=Tropicimonas sp. IMCC6043 TaxID=2510645 RepID=UPI0013EE2227|nr:serine/threonine-protein kinase [Tropicimonas sp. IMCC6043]